MKRLSNLLFALLVISGLPCTASENFSIPSKTSENPSQNLKVIHVCHLTEIELKETMLGRHPEIAVEFSAQTLLPISFFLKGDLVNLVEDEVNTGTLEIKQTFYARVVEQKLILSTNLTEWKPFLEFITGMASVYLSIQNGQPAIVVGADTNYRF